MERFVLPSSSAHCREFTLALSWKNKQNIGNLQSAQTVQLFVTINVLLKKKGQLFLMISHHSDCPSNCKAQHNVIVRYTKKAYVLGY